MIRSDLRTRQSRKPPRADMSGEASSLHCQDWSRQTRVSSCSQPSKRSEPESSTSRAPMRVIRARTPSVTSISGRPKLIAKRAVRPTSRNQVGLTWSTSARTQPSSGAWKLCGPQGLTATAERGSSRTVRRPTVTARGGPSTWKMRWPSRCACVAIVRSSAWRAARPNGP